MVPFLNLPTSLLPRSAYSLDMRFCRALLESEYIHLSDQTKLSTSTRSPIPHKLVPVHQLLNRAHELQLTPPPTGPVHRAGFPVGMAGLLGSRVHNACQLGSLLLGEPITFGRGLPMLLLSRAARMSRFDVRFCDRPFRTSSCDRFCQRLSSSGSIYTGHDALRRPERITQSFKRNPRRTSRAGRAVRSVAAVGSDSPYKVAGSCPFCSCFNWHFDWQLQLAAARFVARITRAMQHSLETELDVLERHAAACLSFGCTDAATSRRSACRCE
eukprot:6204400-Pleurochrysis_carterae.AAC.2